VLSTIHKKLNIKSVYFNIDFTPYAIKRDESIIQWCHKNNISCKTFEDYTLLPINTVLNNTQSYYSVFTPFYKRFLSLHDKIYTVKHSTQNSLAKHIYKEKYIGSLKSAQIAKYYDKANPYLFVQGGRENGLRLIERVKDKSQFTLYDKNRDFPFLDGTTRLSPYLKFGCISIREVYDAVKNTYGINHGLIRELIWRDFYASIVFNKPRVLNGQIDKRKGNLSFKDKYDNLRWMNNNDNFLKWCKGETGVPLVDAAMRQLNTCGWMHNRCRMIVASFLIKDLLIDWRKGEQYFATKLIDYDPASNNGGWQFCSSTGVDAQPYFRIFNPFTQSKKFDVDAQYIKHWVKELNDIPARDIHSWNVSYKKYASSCDYPSPIVEHSIQSKKALQIYKAALS
jgi:deoxyribodipyrimidine photo-lyase